MDYIHIGKIVATHGVTGEFVIQHVLNKKTSLDKAEAIFIEELKGSFIPYFVEKSKAVNTEEIICKTEHIGSKEAAHRLIKKNVWLTKEDFAKIAGASAPVSLIGYMVYNEEKPLSKVEEVIEQPHQILLKIFVDSKEVLIPLHEETLDSIDRKDQKIYLTLPDGLLDVYLKD